jgi:hypothetical protein
LIYLPTQGENQGEKEEGKHIFRSLGSKSSPRTAGKAVEIF